MTKINQITRLRGCGIFRDFSWTPDLPEFGKYNLIYGWNGTGKATLSGLFQDLQLSRTPKIGDAVLCINGTDLPGQEFSQSEYPIRVFNRDFIEKNVFYAGAIDMPPIFVLGVESVANQRRVEGLKRSLEKTKDKLQSARSEKRRTHKELEQFCIEIARSIKNKLRTSGNSRYNNYGSTGICVAQVHSVRV